MNDPGMIYFLQAQQHRLPRLQQVLKCIAMISLVIAFVGAALSSIMRVYAVSITPLRWRADNDIIYIRSQKEAIFVRVSYGSSHGNRLILSGDF